jgi:glucan phosphoethanolaminetransferase (alkaline phosphatase superfamily)
MSKEELEKRLNKLMRTRRLFVILSFSLLAIAIMCDVATLILYLLKVDYPQWLYLLLLEGGSLCFAASIALFFVRMFAIDTKIRNSMYKYAQDHPEEVRTVDLGTVDVKEANPQPAPQTDRKHELVKQYENLMNQGLITPEEYAMKKKEILGE